MTTEQEQSNEQFISAMEEMSEVLRQGPDFRANVPAGQNIGSEHVANGADVNWDKRQSMVRMGDERVPERMYLWNTQSGRGSLVSTPIAQKRLLRGTKQYPASAFTLRDPGLPQKEPIDLHCRVCDTRRAAVGNGPKPFYDEVQYDIHMMLKHPMTMRLEERREQHDERLKDRESNKEFLRELVTEIVGIQRIAKNIDVDDEEEAAIVEAIASQVSAPAYNVDDYTTKQLREMVEGKTGKPLPVRYLSKEKLVEMLEGNN